MNSSTPSTSASESAAAYIVILHQFFPAYDLQAYCRFAQIPYTVQNSAYPSYTSTGDLPQLQHGQVLVGGPRILSYLKKVGSVSELGNWYWHVDDFVAKM